VAEILRITDKPGRDPFERRDLIRDGSVQEYIDPLITAAQQQHLKRLWREIVQLPYPQRVSLLLAMRGGHRISAAVLFFELEIADIREIAEALEIAVDEFGRIFSSLPLDDRAISKFLGVGRQQVISYRLSAKRRLARRMRSACNGKTYC
jgi:hypothetical protein